jgi:cysteine desulfurase/selenocysteine lyase
VRSGMHCAEPLISSFNEKGLVRASMYFYNSIEEINVFIKALKKIVSVFG